MPDESTPDNATPQPPPSANTEPADASPAEDGLPAHLAAFAAVHAAADQATQAVVRSLSSPGLANARRGSH